MTGKTHDPTKFDPHMAAAWRRYREMVADRQLRDHLGLSAEQWENEPADFIDWARDFFEVERKVTQ